MAKKQNYFKKLERKLVESVGLKLGFWKCPHCGEWIPPAIDKTVDNGHSKLKLPDGSEKIICNRK